MYQPVSNLLPSYLNTKVEPKKKLRLALAIYNFKTEDHMQLQHRVVLVNNAL